MSTLNSADKALSALNRGIITQTEYNNLAERNFKAKNGDTIIIRADKPSLIKAFEALTEDLVTSSFNPLRATSSVFDNLCVSFLISYGIQIAILKGELEAGWPTGFPSAAKFTSPPAVREQAIKEREKRIDDLLSVFSWALEYVDLTQYSEGDDFNPIEFIKTAYKEVRPIEEADLKLIAATLNRNKPEKAKLSLAQVKVMAQKDEKKSAELRSTHADFDEVWQWMLKVSEFKSEWSATTYENVLNKTLIKLDEWICNTEDRLCKSRGTVARNNASLITIMDGVLKSLQTELKQVGTWEKSGYIGQERESEKEDNLNGHEEVAELSFH